MSILTFAALTSLGITLILLRYARCHFNPHSLSNINHVTRISQTAYHTLHVPILGVPQSGKTALFATLCHQLKDLEHKHVKTRLLEVREEEELRKRHLDLHHDQDATSTAGSRSTQEMIETEYAALMNGALNRSSRRAETGYTCVTYHVSDDSTQRPATLEMMALVAWEDLPGDFLTHEHLHESNIYPRLESASGLILAIDGVDALRARREHRQSMYFLPYQRAVEHYLKQSLDSRPIWVVITKADRLPKIAQGVELWRDLIAQHVIMTLQLTREISQPLISLVGLQRSSSRQVPVRRQGQQFLNVLRTTIDHRIEVQNARSDLTKKQTRLRLLAILSLMISIWLVQGIIDLKRLPAIQGERVWSTSSLEDTRRAYLERYQQSKSLLSPLYIYQRQFTSDLTLIYLAHCDFLSEMLNDYLAQTTRRLEVKAHPDFVSKYIQLKRSPSSSPTRSLTRELSELAESISHFEQDLARYQLMTHIDSIRSRLISTLLEDIKHLFTFEHHISEYDPDQGSSSLSTELHHWNQRCLRNVKYGCQVMMLMRRAHTRRLDLYMDQIRSSSLRHSSISSSTHMIDLVKKLAQWCVHAHQLDILNVRRSQIKRLSDRVWRLMWSNLDQRSRSMSPEKTGPQDHLKRLKILRSYRHKVTQFQAALKRANLPEVISLSLREPLLIKRRYHRSLRAETLTLARITPTLPKKLKSGVDQALSWSIAQLDPRRRDRIRYLRSRDAWRTSLLDAIKSRSLVDLRESSARLDQELIDLQSSPGAVELKTELMQWSKRAQSLSAWLKPHLITLTIREIKCKDQALISAQERHSWTSLKRYTDLQRFYVLLEHHAPKSSDLTATSQRLNHQRWIAIKEGASKTMMWAPEWRIQISVYELDGAIDRVTRGREYDDTLIGHPHILTWGLPSPQPAHVALNQEQSCHASLQVKDSWPEWLKRMRDKLN